MQLRSGPGYSISQANDAVEAQALEKTATFHIKVQQFEACKDDNSSAYRIMAPDGQVNVNGTFIRYRTWVYFPPEQTADLATVHRGGNIVVSGIIKRADIDIEGGKPVLNVDLRNARVEP